MSKAKTISALFAALLLTAACSAGPTGPDLRDQRPAPGYADDADLGADGQERARTPQVFDDDGNKLRN